MKNSGVRPGEVPPPRPFTIRGTETDILGCSSNGTHGLDWLFTYKGYLSHVRETDGLANGAIGGVDYTPEERRKIAKEYVPLLGPAKFSQTNWRCLCLSTED